MRFEMHHLIPGFRARRTWTDCNLELTRGDSITLPDMKIGPNAIVCAGSVVHSEQRASEYERGL